MPLSPAFSLSWCWRSFSPNRAPTGGWLHAESLSDWGLALIMFLQGLSMPLGKARQGAGNCRLHILIQSFTFVIFPIVSASSRWRQHFSDFAEEVKSTQSLVLFELLITGHKINNFSYSRLSD
jgi:predicted Na+-dependent transporter